MNSHEANHVRGLLIVVDQELDGCRKMLGALLTQGFAECIDKTSARSILSEVEESMSRAFRIIDTELDEPAPEIDPRPTIADQDTTGYIW